MNCKMINRKNSKRVAQKQNTLKLKVDRKNEEIKLDSFELKITSETTSTATLSIVMSKCRLCEGKDGPFVDIFDAERNLFKKVDEIMPFVIDKYDELPQKICFRCSAKVEEVYEFIQKCVKSQANLCKAIGKEDDLKGIQYNRSTWEGKLTQCNISNDDYCNALIQKAMESIENIPIKPLEEAEQIPLKKAMELESTHLIQNKIESNLKIFNLKSKDIGLSLDSSNNDKDQSEMNSKALKPPEINIVKINTFSLDDDSADVTSKELPTFNIMDHVSKIKVNGVGDLYQCKLCNRNFLIKEVVLNHRCAKNGGKKIAVEKKIVVPPKVPLVKYINTKTQSEIPFKSNPNNTPNRIVNTTPIDLDEDDEENKVVPPQPKQLKRRIGPASRVRHENAVVSQTSMASQSSTTQNSCATTTVSTTMTPPVEMPPPNSNTKFKIVSGPKNTFIFVETKSSKSPDRDSISNMNTLDKINKCITVKHVSKDNNSGDHGNESVSCTSEKPYPVRLIKSGVSDNKHSSSMQQSPSANNKQSYTIFQSDNPSKLLISTKAQPVDNRLKWLNKSIKDNLSISSENPNTQFTFVNVDPIVQPSYVLPTRNIIQESQISTSTIKQGEERDKYPCNLCGETFSREMKLKTHIQFHYNKLEEEDQNYYQKKRKLKS